MGKLKACCYLKNNKKRAAILVISFALYFALIYGVQFFMDPMFYTDKSIYLGNAKLMQRCHINMAGKLPLNEELWNEDSMATDEEKIQELNRAIGDFAKELANDERIDHVFQGFTYYIQIQTLTGPSHYNIPMITKDEAKLMCDYLGYRLIEGSYPTNPGDIVMDQNMARNQDLSVGDRLENSTNQVCGILSGDHYFAVGISFDEMIVKRNLFFLDQGTLPDLKQFFQEKDWEASEKESSQIQILSDSTHSRKLLEDMKKGYDQPLTIMVYAITVIMGVTLYFVYQLHVRDRYEEWCLYRSLGYSQREVFGLALREYGLCTLASGILALVLLILIFGIGGSMMSSKGIFYRLLLPETCKQIIAIIVLLTGILQIPVLRAMQHITTIDGIEDDI